MSIPKEDAGLFAWADFYRSSGMSIIPLRELRPGEKGKKPAIEWKEFQSRIATRKELGGWFINSGWGLAVVCGKVSGNLIRLDFDDPADFPKLKDKLPESPTFLSQRKGGGYGVLMKSTTPVPLLPQKTFKKYPKLEVRGEGGITVLPPTPGYSWVGPMGDIPTVDVPKMLKDLLDFDLNNRQKLADSVDNSATDELANLLRETTEGERNNNLVRITGMLRARGIDLETALVVMEHNFEEHWPHEGMDWDEARQTFERAWKRYEHEGVRLTASPATDRPNWEEEDDDRVRFMRLDEIEPPTDKDVLVDHLVLAGESGNTLIAAPTKYGKTSLMMDAAVSMTQGKPVWGRLKVDMKLKVAFLDQERKFQQIRENQLLMACKIGEPDYSRLMLAVQETGQFDITHTKTLDTLYGKLAAFGPDVIVLDGWGWFVRHQASDSKLVMPAMAWLKKMRQSLDCATIIIHHFKKAPQSSGKLPDHYELVDGIDQIEGLKRLSDQAQTVILYTPIPNTDTFNLLEGRTNKPAWDPLKFVIDYDETTLTHRIVDAEEGRELFEPEMFRRLWAQTASTRRVKSMINMICNTTGLTRTQLAEKMGANKSQISKWYSGINTPSKEFMQKLEEEYARARQTPMKASKMPRPRAKETK